MRDTTEMAREANMPFYWRSGEITYLEQLKVFEALVRADEREETNRRANASWTLMCKKMVAAEREACADIADNHIDGTPDWNSAANNIAQAIRARGQA